MSYEVLARKLRPMGFDALVGQEHVVRALRHALDNGRLHHAYLFTGTRGVGKTTIARILAKALNCETGVSATPCEVCSICTEVRENRFVDLIEVDAASRTGVDDTRDLLENAQYLPTRGRYKVYLIDEVHMLSTASFNALLKTLEEPPEHVKFLLATTDPKKVPVTVLSRCLQFQLKNLTRAEIAAYLGTMLTQEQVEHDEAALEVIAKSAAGSMRDALSLTDQAIAYGQGALRGDDVIAMLGAVGRNEVDALLDAVASGAPAGVLELSAELASRSADFKEVLQGMLEAFHELAVAGALGKGDNRFSPEELQLYYQIALHGHRDLSLAPDDRSGFEMTLLRLLTFAPVAGSSVPPRTPGSASVDEGDSGVAGGEKQAGADVARTEPRQRAANQTTASQAEADKAEADKEEADKEEAQTDAGATVGAAASTAQPESDPAPADQDTKAPAPVVAQAPATGPLDDFWFDTVDQLDLGGVARMIAEHSILENYALPNVALLLDADHDTLLSDAQQKTLARALGAALGQDITLSITTGALAKESPAARRQRLAEERQAAAEASIQSDINVKALVHEFGGHVEQIRPI